MPETASPQMAFTCAGDAGVFGPGPNARTVAPVIYWMILHIPLLIVALVITVLLANFVLRPLLPKSALKALNKAGSPESMIALAVSVRYRTRFQLRWLGQFWLGNVGCTSVFKSAQGCSR